VIGGETGQILKEWRKIGMRTLNCGANQSVGVYIQVDRSGVWSAAGTVTVSPWQMIELPQSDFTTKTTASGCTTSTINITGSTADMSAGDFARIGDEWAQVATVASTTQFTLVNPLTTAPAAGVSVYPSYPVGREIQYRLTLGSTTSAATPKVLGVTLYFMERIVDKFRFSLSPRLEDGMVDRAGAPYPYDAATARTALYKWVKRVPRFTLIDPMGQQWQVKAIGGSEGAFTREDVAEQPRAGSRISLQLIEC
jgi:hypothetical protein